MTFKDLQKAIQSQTAQIAAARNLQARLQGKPFWIFDKEEHRRLDVATRGQCCFWHTIGCPQKDGHDMPVLPYQRTLYEALQNHKHKQMLAHTKKLMEYNGGQIAINPKFEKLVISLHTAYDKGEGVLDKEQTSYNDIFDALRLSVRFYK